MTRNKVWEAINTNSIVLYENLFQTDVYKSLEEMFSDSSGELCFKGPAEALYFCHNFFRHSLKEWNKTSNPLGIIDINGKHQIGIWFVNCGLLEKVRNGYLVFGAEYAFLSLMKGG